MHALVTGAAGFIGSALCRRLLNEGFTVLGIDSFAPYYGADLKRQNLEFIGENPNFTFVEADLNTMDLSAVVQRPDFIFHLAGQPGVRGSWGKGFEEYAKANILATQRLLDFALTLPALKRFVYASSSSIYGNAERYPTQETDRPQPVSPYGVTKLAGEHLCYLYAVESNLPTVSLRFFTVYGPRQRPDMAFTRFLSAAIEDRELTIYGDGTQIRDFTFVGDIVEANLSAARIYSEPGSVFNVSGGSNVSVNEVLGVIAGFVDRPLKVNRIARVSGDVFRTGGSMEAIGEALGWKPSVGIVEGLRLQFDWLRSVLKRGDDNGVGEVEERNSLAPIG